jgi:hypothetical protein
MCTLSNTHELNGIALHELARFSNAYEFLKKRESKVPHELLTKTEILRNGSFRGRTDCARYDSRLSWENDGELGYLKFESWSEACTLQPRHTSNSN